MTMEELEQPALHATALLKQAEQAMEALNELRPAVPPPPETLAQIAIGYVLVDIATSLREIKWKLTDIFK